MESGWLLDNWGFAWLLDSRFFRGYREVMFRYWIIGFAWLLDNWVLCGYWIIGFHLVIGKSGFARLLDNWVKRGRWIIGFCVFIQ